MKFFQKITIVSSVLYAAIMFAQNTVPLANKNATKETQNLYKNLWLTLDKGIMFGHQDDLGYGVNWRMQEGRSDVKETAGDYPAVFGWDVMNMESGGKGPIDIFSFKEMKKMMETVYNMGKFLFFGALITNLLEIGFGGEKETVPQKNLKLFGK